MRTIGPIAAEVIPGGVYRLDERDFLCPRPALDLFLAGNGRLNVCGLLVVDEAADVVASGEARRRCLAVLRQAFFEVVGDAGVERAGGAGEDVDGVLVLHFERLWLRFKREQSLRDRMDGWLWTAGEIPRRHGLKCYGMGASHRRSLTGQRSRAECPPRSLVKTAGYRRRAK